LDSTIKVRDASSGREIFTLKQRGVGGVTFSPDGKWIASGGWNRSTRAGTVKFWDATSGQELFTLKDTGPVGSVAFSPDGKRIAGGVKDRSRPTVEVWDVSRSIAETRPSG
jgi:WD40 repeat protein